MAKKIQTMVHRIPITKARHNRGQVVKRVHLNKEYFILEKDGIPVERDPYNDATRGYLESLRKDGQPIPTDRPLARLQAIDTTIVSRYKGMEGKFYYTRPFPTYRNLPPRHLFVI